MPVATRSATIAAAGPAVPPPIPPPNTPPTLPVVGEPPTVTATIAAPPFPGPPQQHVPLVPSAALPLVTPSVLVAAQPLPQLAVPIPNVQPVGAPGSYLAVPTAPAAPLSQPAHAPVIAAAPPVGQPAAPALVGPAPTAPQIAAPVQPPPANPVGAPVPVVDGNTAIPMSAIQQLFGLITPLLTQQQHVPAAPAVVQVNTGQDPVWAEGVYVQTWLEDFYMYSESLGRSEPQAVASALASLTHQTAGTMARNLAGMYRSQKPQFATWNAFKQWATTFGEDSTRPRRLQSEVFAFKAVPGVSLSQTNARFMALVTDWANTDASIRTQLGDPTSWLSENLRGVYANAFRDWPDKSVYSRLLSSMESNPTLEEMYRRSENLERVAISVGKWTPLELATPTLNVAAQPQATLQIPGMATTGLTPTMATPSTLPQIVGTYRRGAFLPRGGREPVTRTPQPLTSQAISALLVNANPDQQLLALQAPLPPHHQPAPVSDTATSLLDPARLLTMQTVTNPNAIAIPSNQRRPDQSSGGGRWVTRQRPKICLRCGEDGHFVAECSHRDLPNQARKVSKLASQWIRCFNERPPRWVPFQEWAPTSEEAARLEAARAQLRTTGTDWRGRPAPFPTTTRVPQAMEQRVGHTLTNRPPLATREPAPTIAVMAERFVQTLHRHGLAVVEMEDTPAVAVQTQTNGMEDGASARMDVDVTADAGV